MILTCWSLKIRVSLCVTRHYIDMLVFENSRVAVCYPTLHWHVGLWKFACRCVLPGMILTCWSLKIRVSLCVTRHDIDMLIFENSRVAVCYPTWHWHVGLWKFACRCVLPHITLTCWSLKIRMSLCVTRHYIDMLVFENSRVAVCYPTLHW
jgi:hypothetical protein